MLERIPDDKLDWQPHPKSHTNPPPTVIDSLHATPDKCLLDHIRRGPEVAVAVAIGIVCLAASGEQERGLDFERIKPVEASHAEEADV